ncbi:hypothetical protein GCM10023324_05240 [Streptomyces youssoufiensis]
MAARIAPIAKTVTLCPAVLSLTPRSRLISGSTPAGIVSVRSVMNPVVAKARRPASGSRAFVVERGSRVSGRVITSPSMGDISVKVNSVCAESQNVSHRGRGEGYADR